ncbi:GNAT family N-acetyltransferase [Parendozoicomonas haliclonae]|uniref:N-acetyltransferase domain-containing protein n=2 Tax=Parendozoicomonas haliclonae TaxID=1960125 RepID=A0A1X7AFE6_9GAMM|nr:hypothetical protein EHSB41UT_00744 [Parendozoicomonas haliclonae]
MTLLIKAGTLDDVLQIDALIPEFDSRNTRSKLEARLEGKDSLALIATVDGQLAGYKLGYALSDTTFYSWLGGVAPAFRKHGIATQLRLHQEDWAKESGYTAIEVKSMNRFPAMLQLLISSGYQIVGYEEGAQLGDGKISFRKSIT